MAGQGFLELSLPQDVDTISSPTFAGMTLTGLNGVVVGNGTAATGAVETTTPGAVLRLNAAGTAYEFAALAIADLTDSSDLELIRFMRI